MTEHKELQEDVRAMANYLLDAALEYTEKTGASAEVVCNAFINILFSVMPTLGLNARDVRIIADEVHKNILKTGGINVRETK